MNHEERISNVERLAIVLLTVFLTASIISNLYVYSEAQKNARALSWIMYGVAIVHFMTFFKWDLISAQPGNIQLPDGQITIDSAIFFLASMFMIAEAWNSYKSKD